MNGSLHHPVAVERSASVAEARPPRGDGLTPRQIAEATYRANPGLALRAFNALSSPEKHALRELARDPDFYGLITRPNGPTSLTKAVSRETALLFLTLQTPARLPSYLNVAGLDTLVTLVRGLVLDGVIEIERAGRFVSGAEAFSTLTDWVPQRPSGRLARLSSEAIEYGQHVKSTDVLNLAARLYCYNTVPLSKQWRRRLPSTEHVRDFIGHDAGTGNGLQRYWKERGDAGPPSEWVTYVPRRAVDSTHGEDQRYKLYVSPVAADIKPAFAALVETLIDYGTSSLQGGRRSPWASEARQTGRLLRHAGTALLGCSTSSRAY